jgi:hypothetical protein
MHEYLATALAAQRIAELRAEAAECRRYRRARAEQPAKRHGDGLAHRSPSTRSRL